jgi:hypothetical protein
MQIPNPKPLGMTKDSWSREGQKCKNSERFLENYDAVFANRKREHGHVKYVYKDGKRYVLPNPSTHGEEAQKAWDKFNKETGGLNYKIESIV